METWLLRPAVLCVCGINRNMGVSTDTVKLATADNREKHVLHNICRQSRFGNTTETWNIVEIRHLPWNTVPGLPSYLENVSFLLVFSARHWKRVVKARGESGGGILFESDHCFISNSWLGRKDRTRIMVSLIDYSGNPVTLSSLILGNESRLVF